MRPPLLRLYEMLFQAYGKQGWWPGATPFEVVVGAILTQRVAWRNVERAVENLKADGLLHPLRLADAPLVEIARLIRPTVYFNEKARKLKAFLDLLVRQYGGELSLLLSLPVASLRRELLTVRGIGEETADAIVLYAAGKPSFVVDAYTRRILGRLGEIEGRQTYAALRARFMDDLPEDTALYNEYHALLVRHGKERCVKRAPLCDGCPLADRCAYGRGG